jgi:hypothetical protein
LLLHYPLSGFLTIFAHVLQNPKDPKVASDLKLMEFVTSFFTVPEVNVSQFSATAPLIFRELQIVAAKFVERSNSDVAKTTTKRTHDACDLEQDHPQDLADGPELIRSSPLPNGKSKAPDSLVCSSFTPLKSLTIMEYYAMTLREIRSNDLHFSRYLLQTFHIITNACQLVCSVCHNPTASRSKISIPPIL